MNPKGERWPPVYDLEDLLSEIKRLSDHPDVASAFYAWRKDRSPIAVDDVCQGDIVHLPSEVPVISDDGQPAVLAHPEAFWLVIGNTCDFDRSVEDARWTQLVPIVSLEVPREQQAILRRYTQARRFYVPAWTATPDAVSYVADFLRPVAVDKRAMRGESSMATVHARMSLAAWVLLNACLVRFLARDDGRFD